MKTKNKRTFVVSTKREKNFYCDIAYSIETLPEFEFAAAPVVARLSGYTGVTINRWQSEDFWIDHQNQLDRTTTESLSRDWLEYHGIYALIDQLDAVRTDPEDHLDDWDWKIATYYGHPSEHMPISLMEFSETQPEYPSPYPTIQASPKFASKALRQSEEAAKELQAAAVDRLTAEGRELVEKPEEPTAEPSSSPTSLSPSVMFSNADLLSHVNLPEHCPACSFKLRPLYEMLNPAEEETQTIKTLQKENKKLRELVESLKS